jgi:hypothetical protein
MDKCFFCGADYGDGQGVMLRPHELPRGTELYFANAFPGNHEYSFPACPACRGRIGIPEQRRLMFQDILATVLVQCINNYHTGDRSIIASDEERQQIEDTIRPHLERPETADFLRRAREVRDGQHRLN